METIRAVYEGGVLRPMGPLNLREHVAVTVYVVEEVGTERGALPLREWLTAPIGSLAALASGPSQVSDFDDEDPD